MQVDETTREAASSLLTRLIQDLVPRLRTDQLTCGLVLPARRALQVLGEWADDGPRPGNARKAGEGAESVQALWDRVQESVPEAAAFPLGSVTERSIKRLAFSLLRQVSETGETARETGIGQILKEHSPGQILHLYLSLWLFEAALLDLRGSSQSLEDDYGFWYHWRPQDNRFRPPREEGTMRQQLADACRKAGFEMLAVWKKSGVQPPFDPTESQISETFSRVFGAVPRQAPAWRRAGRREYPINVFGALPDAKMLEDPYAIAKDEKLIAVHGERANVLLDTSELVRLCGGELDSRLQDLIEIATTVYMADIHIARDPLLARNLVFLIPVRHPDIWSRHAAALARLVGFLTRNVVDFHFSPGPEAAAGQRRDLQLSQDESCVALFSGGVDSFVGAAHLLQSGRRALLVSHYPAPMLRGVQQRVFRCLPEDGIAWAAVRVGRAGREAHPAAQLGQPPPQTLYQHARSFLFLSLATALALQKGIADIYVAENGPVALNSAFSEARFNTRTTHPHFLEGYQDWIRNVFQIEVRIHNPFGQKTKGEVLGLLPSEYHRHLATTNSCWSYSKVKLWASQFAVAGFSGAHCGRCLPCIWRRTAFQAAGLNPHDDTYLGDCVPDDRWERWLSRSRQTMLLDQLRFCRNALGLSDQALLDLCPDLEAGQSGTEDRLALYRRFSKEMTAWSQSEPAQRLWAFPVNLAAEEA